MVSLSLSLCLSFNPWRPAHTHRSARTHLVQANEHDLESAGWSANRSSWPATLSGSWHLEFGNGVLWPLSTSAQSIFIIVINRTEKNTPNGADKAAEMANIRRRHHNFHPNSLKPAPPTHCHSHLDDDVLSSTPQTVALITTKSAAYALKLTCWTRQPTSKVFAIVVIIITAAIVVILATAAVAQSSTRPFADASSTGHRVHVNSDLSFN